MVNLGPRWPNAKTKQSEYIWVTDFGCKAWQRLPFKFRFSEVPVTSGHSTWWQRVTKQPNDTKCIAIYGVLVCAIYGVLVCLDCDLWVKMSEVHIAKRDMCDSWIGTLSTQAPGPCRSRWPTSNRHACSFKTSGWKQRLQIEAVSCSVSTRRSLEAIRSLSQPILPSCGRPDWTPVFAWTPALVTLVDVRFKSIPNLSKVSSG